MHNERCTSGSARGGGKPAAAMPPRRPRPTLPVVRLLDGSRAYVHAVIDNFSRRILAWTVADKGNGLNTVEVLKAALDRLDTPVESVEVMVDGGSENFNERVDALFGASVLERVLARVDVIYSNSMIEAFYADPTIMRTTTSTW